MLGRCLLLEVSSPVWVGGWVGVRGGGLGSGQKVFYVEKFDLSVVYFLLRSCP